MVHSCIVDAYSAHFFDIGVVCSDGGIGKGDVLNWISMTVTEFKSWVLVVFISKFINPVNDVGWSGKRGECRSLDLVVIEEV